MQSNLRKTLEQIEYSLGQAACELDDVSLAVQMEDEAMSFRVTEAYEGVYSAMIVLANIRTDLEEADRKLPKFGASCV